MFSSLFKSKKKSVEPKIDKKVYAVVALLCEAAMIDEEFGENEKQVIIKILKDQFQIKDPDEISDIFKTTLANLEESGDLVSYTREVKDNWKLEDRVNIIEMLWSVCLVDGKVEPYEDMLIRKVAGLLYVGDRDKNLAKKIAKEKL
tara:strand:+ start:10 stop:447 length:438 start_codon:yes stop_codon:yes gene_type:complete